MQRQREFSFEEPSLHTRAIAHEGERLWLTPLLFALLGTVLGVVLQAALR